MRRRAPLRSCLRLVWLAMLMFGLCLQPAFAAACDIEDARTVLDHEAGAATNADDGDAAGDPADCCANPACGDCCLHATASLPAMPHTSTILPPHAYVALQDTASAPSDYPVDSRPPIRS